MSETTLNSLMEKLRKEYARDCPVDKMAMDAWFNRKKRGFNKRQVMVIVKKIIA